MVSIPADIRTSETFGTLRGIFFGTLLGGAMWTILVLIVLAF